VVILNIYLASGYDDVISEPILALAGFNFVGFVFSFVSDFALFCRLISFV
jgi:hypothetical protein